MQNLPVICHRYSCPYCLLLSHTFSFFHTSPLLYHCLSSGLFHFPLSVLKENLQHCGEKNWRMISIFKNIVQTNKNPLSNNFTNNKKKPKWASLYKSENLQDISAVIHLGTRDFVVKNYILLYLLDYCIHYLILKYYINYIKTN